MASKLVEIADIIYDSIEQITPNLESHVPFNRWQGTTPLDTASDAASMRSFRIDFPDIGKGKLSSNSTYQSKSATISIKIGYPAQYFIKNDTKYLGVEVIRADDDSLIVSELCYKGSTQMKALSNVRSVQYLRSIKSGNSWNIQISIEYMERN